MHKPHSPRPRLKTTRGAFKPAGSRQESDNWRRACRRTKQHNGKRRYVIGEGSAPEPTNQGMKFKSGHPQRFYSDGSLRRLTPGELHNYLNSVLPSE